MSTINYPIKENRSQGQEIIVELLNCFIVKKEVFYIPT